MALFSIVKWVLFRLTKTRFPELTVQDYLDLEALIFRVNAQAVRGTFDVGGESKVSRAFRTAVNAIGVE